MRFERMRRLRKQMLRLRAAIPLSLKCVPNSCRPPDYHCRSLACCRWPRCALLQGTLRLRVEQMNLRRVEAQLDRLTGLQAQLGRQPRGQCRVAHRKMYQRIGAERLDDLNLAIQADVGRPGCEMLGPDADDKFAPVSCRDSTSSQTRKWQTVAVGEIEIAMGSPGLGEVHR